MDKGVLNCDVAIIGAGTAGLAAERSARRAGARTLLIDDRFNGTTCASVGCMPSKLLIASARAAHNVTTAPTLGVSTGPVTIDGTAVMQRVRRLRDEFVAGALKSIEQVPQDSKIKGKARFVDAQTLAVGDATVNAKAIVLATGSRSAIPKPFSTLKNVLTNETVFELETLPSSLAVIGAGPLGLEIAQAFSRLGVDVEVFDEGSSIAALKDDAVASSLLSLLRNEFALHLDTTITAHQRGNDIEIAWTRPHGGKREFSHVLVAAGRPPELKDLSLEKTGIELDDHGTPVFDRNTMQCGTSSIFLAGDCNADVPLLHEASAEGAIAGNNAAHYPAVEKSRRWTPLGVTFTDPPSASIGKPADDDTIIGTSDFSGQGRAKADGRNAGLVRLYADRNGKLTGASMAAPEAEHLAHLVAWSIEHAQTAMQMLELPFYHPTYEEGLRAALREICREADVDFAYDRDRGSAPGI